MQWALVNIVNLDPSPDPSPTISPILSGNAEMF